MGKEKNRIPVFCPENVNTLEWIETIRKISPEVIFSFYYRNLLVRDILMIPSVGSFNFHGSMLPAYRGLCRVNWVLMNGERRTGVTLHHIVEAPDAGDIVGQKEVLIEFEDTAYTLYQKLCVKANELLEEVFSAYQERNSPPCGAELKTMELLWRAEA